MHQAIIWTNADPIHWRIYAALGGDELIYAVQYVGFNSRINYGMDFNGWRADWESVRECL